MANATTPSKDVWLIVGELINLVLLALVILPPGYAITAVGLDPTLPFSLLSWLAIAAIVLGLLFALSGGRGEILHPIALVGGLGAIFYIIARNIPGVPLAATPGERLGEMAHQIISWFSIILAGGQATNNLLFLLLLAIISWLIGYFGAWAVFRERSAWWPVTVSATSLTLILATFPNLYTYMVVQLVAALLLVGRMNFQAREAIWGIRGFRQTGGVAGRAFRASLALAVALVLLTWVAPTALASKAISQSLGHDTRPWEQAQTEFNRLFGGLQAPDQASISGFSRSLTLHGSFHLAETPVLKIVAAKQEYWRVMVLDRYTGHGWLSSDPMDQRTLLAGSDVLMSSDSQRTALSQEITILSPRGSYLVGASEPVVFNRSVHAQAYPADSGSGVDFIAAQSVLPLQTDTRYSVVSQISTASVSELRAANRAYPPEIQHHYLPLPTVPTRVLQLAQQLAANAPDPYDKAVAVETYLRAMPYTLDPPAPPPNQDGVDFFLFDSKTGYCDYFASAMAVLLRSQGVPARVVSGYAPGETQVDGSFLIKDSDSHTWVETYFPPYGWVPFEPSGSWPRFARGNGDSGVVTPTPAPQSPPPPSQSQAQQTPSPTPSPTPLPNGQPPPPPARPPLNLRPLLPYLYVLGTILGLMLLMWYLWERDLRGLPPSLVAYIKMTRLAGLLGLSMRSAETPDEYGRALVSAAPEAATSTSRIVADYERYQFSRQAASDGSDRPFRLWRLVRNALLRRIGRLHRPTGTG